MQITRSKVSRPRTHRCSILGDSQVKYKHQKFDMSCDRFPTLFVTRTCSHIDDFHEEIDLLPPTVIIVVFRVGTNDLGHCSLQVAEKRYGRLQRLVLSRPEFSVVVCRHGFSRSENRRRAPRTHHSCQGFITNFKRRAGVLKRILAKKGLSTCGVFLFLPWP